MLTTWSTDAHPPADRFDAWADVLTDSFLRWKITTRARPDVEARVRQRRFGDFRFLHCECDVLSGSRATPEVRETADDLLCLLHVVSGAELVVVDGQESLLRPGDSLLWSSRHKVDFRVGERVEKMTLMVPAERSRSISALFPDFVGAPLTAEHGIASLFGKYLRALEEEIWTLPEEGAEAIMQATLELLLQAFASGTTVRPIGRAATLGRIKKDILDRLSDPSLSPVNIAQGAGISVRYLHLLFAQDGSTVSAWIQRQRVERVKAALCNTRLQDHSITELALRAGFNDSSQFGRVFKRFVGVTPSAFRLGH